MRLITTTEKTAKVLGVILFHQCAEHLKPLMRQVPPVIELVSYGRQHKRYDKYMDTHIINAFERCVFEFEDENPQEHIR